MVDSFFFKVKTKFKNLVEKISFDLFLSFHLHVTDLENIQGQALVKWKYKDAAKASLLKADYA